MKVTVPRIPPKPHVRLDDLRDGECFLFSEGEDPANVKMKVYRSIFSPSHICSAARLSDGMLYEPLGSSMVVRVDTEVVVNG